MHYKNVKSILSSNNGMNIYRGCTHGCIYCDSRSKVYNMNHKFEDIEVKQNSLILLKKALQTRKKCMIGTGSMSDPYMPIEKRLKYTQNALKLIYRYGFGFTCITKSKLILRDLDLLKKINEKSKTVIQMTLTTYDEELCRKIEPNVCTTYERFEVLKKLDSEGIPTVVWLTPLLPFINDSEENIKGILNYCRDANVYGIICPGIGMTLREGNREYFYSKLPHHLKEKYVETYGDRYFLKSRNHRHLMKLLKSSGFEIDMNKIFEYLHEFPSKDYQSTLY